MKKSKLIIFFVILYIIVTGISYGIFSKFVGGKLLVGSPIPSATKTSNGSVAFDQSLPKTQVCPLNGMKYSQQQEAWWQKHGPLAVMIENHTEARPQSGLSFADVVYEAVAEGGITRFAGIFYCQDAPEVGPVRSARTYFIDEVSEYGPFPLYAHVGGANAPGPADALGQIEQYGWAGYNDLNQFSIGFPTYWRDYDRLGHPVATEHTMYSTTSKLWDFAKTQRGLTNIDKKGTQWDEKFIPFSFKDDAPLLQRPASQSIHMDFWANNPDYAVDWVYDRENNVYKRINGGSPHIDFDTKKQLTTKNIIVLFMKEENANDGYQDNEHLLYQNIGSGKTKIFLDGKEIDGIWKKASRTARTLLFDSNGSAITFDRGTLWYEILPSSTTITVK